MTSAPSIAASSASVPATASASASPSSSAPAPSAAPAASASLPPFVPRDPPVVTLVDSASYASEPDRFVAGSACAAPKGMPTWSWGTLVRVEGLEMDAVVLTIDAGARPSNLLRELDILKEKDVRATVFLYTGELSKRADGPDVLKRIVADGHELGNHTLTHRDLTKLSDDEVGVELDAVETFAKDSVGLTTRPYFRAPFLAMNDPVTRVVNQRCYRSVWITFDTRDDRADATSDDIVRAVFEDKGAAREIQRGSILLFHGSQPANLDALPRVIDGLRARGFAILRLSDALRLAKPATSKTAPAKPDAAKVEPSANPSPPVPTAP